MNKDTLQLIGQVILIAFGPLLAKHNVTLGNSDLDLILGGLSTLGGIVWKFWHWNATPSAPAASQTVPINRIVSALALTSALFFFMFGCAQLAPGADPLVVRCEQTETTAKGTFDAILGIDNGNRDFFATNAPPFHRLCEWLRTPQTVEETNTLPRASAMLVSLDDVKLAYQAGRATSNDVVTVLLPINSALSQAGSWLNILQPSTH